MSRLDIGFLVLIIECVGWLKVGHQLYSKKSTYVEKVMSNRDCVLRDLNNIAQRLVSCCAFTIRPRLNICALKIEKRNLLYIFIY